MTRAICYSIILLFFFSCESEQKKELDVLRESEIEVWDFSKNENWETSNYGSKISGGQLNTQDGENKLALNASNREITFQTGSLHKGDELYLCTNSKINKATIFFVITYIDQSKMHSDVKTISSSNSQLCQLDRFKIVIPWDITKLRISAILSKGELALSELSLRTDFSNQQGSQLPRLNLIIPDSSLIKLDQYKARALENGVISSQEKKYVKAFVKDAGVYEKAQLRLKGDWTDHLKSEKDSYRIKMKKQNAFMGWRSYSIQHPSTRRYLNEWVLHEIAKMEGLLTTDFGYVNVQINEENKGIYAIEEHFDKQLVESSDYREGPILKIDESGTWESTLDNLKKDTSKAYPYFESSLISVFKKNRTRKSENLFVQFEEGSRLLQLFIDGHLQLDQLFDIDKLAKFYALTEIAGFNHATRWHNRRFYFNPVTQKLEHILYDVLPFASNTEDFYMKSKLTRTSTIPEFSFDNAIFLDAHFKERFLYHLNLRANDQYLDSVFAFLDPELEFLESCIQAEEPNYNFDKERFYAHAAFLQEELVGFDEYWSARVEKYLHPNDWLRPMNYELIEDTTHLKNIAVNAYTTEYDSSNYRVFFENYHLGGVKLQSVLLDSGQNYKEELPSIIELEAFQDFADTTSIVVNEQPKKIFYEITNNPGRIYAKKIMPWSKPTDKTTRIKLEQSAIHGLNKIIIDGEMKISKLFFIPKGTELKVMPGSRIVFESGGGIICNEGIEALGNANQPIQFICTDSSSNGITLIGGKTEMKFCSISGMSNLNYEGWMQTGALTIYESEVFMQNVNIYNSHAEDALNIIRSEFEISDLAIDTTFSDGFDADFCSGQLWNSRIANTGNDGLDFSGSIITVSDVNLMHIGDKGISGGENSNLFVYDAVITDCLNGIAAKDESFVFCEEVTVNNAQCQLMAFQKKPEYAPACLIVVNYKSSSQNQNLLIGMGSEIIIDEKYHLGQQFIDIEELYSQFTK